MEAFDGTTRQNEGRIRGGHPVSDEQRRVVDNVLQENVTVVGAGAGSGKTYTTVATVLELLMQGMDSPNQQVSIDQFILITFTNKAADSLRRKIREALQEQHDAAHENGELIRARKWRTQLERLSAAYIGTIHGFCRMVLRTYGYDRGIPRTSDVTFAGYLRKQALRTALNDELDDEQIRLLYSPTGPMEDYQLIGLVEDVLDEIYNRGLRVADVVEWTRKQPNDPGKPYREAFARLVEVGHERYGQKKQERNALDPHQLLTETAALLNGESGDHVVDRLTSRYHYLFVDEFQDTDKTQVGLVNRLNESDGLWKVLVVGDEKQSIYMWRGSPEALLQRFADEYNVPILPMNVSRRPTRRYLDVQNALIQSMADKDETMETLDPYEGTWDPTVDVGAPFTYVNAGDKPGRAGRPARIEATARVIQDLLKQRIHLKDHSPAPVQPGHIVILGRSNRILQEYTEDLRQYFSEDGDSGVAFEIDRGESFYRRPEVVSTYWMLRVLHRGDKDAVLSAAMETPFMPNVDASKKELELIQFGKKREGALAWWLAQHHPKYMQAFKALRGRIQHDTVPQLLEQMFRIFGVRDYFRSCGQQEHVEGLDRLQEITRNLYDEDEALTLRDFIDYLQTSILTERDEKEPPAPDKKGYPPHIRLMTVHRAKGLEFPVVILPEVQQPMRREWEDPPFLVLEPKEQGGAMRYGGIEVKLDEIRSTSTRYDQAVREQRRRTESEELRILYVAITRAEHAAILVGSGKMPDGNPQHRNSWRDEVLHAREDLEAKGAVFVE